MDDNKSLSSEESLQLIASMIQKAKGGFHESGASAILWGSVVGFCGIFSFLEQQLKFSIGFDVWLLVFVAVVPQVFISIRESRERKAISRDESFMNAVWIVYVLTIICVLCYANLVPGATDRLLAKEGSELMMKTNGVLGHQSAFIPSGSSLYIFVYAIPTLVFGIATRQRFLIIGAASCYLFFIVSCFTEFKWDLLLNGAAGICTWLIPGIILRRRCQQGKPANV